MQSSDGLFNEQLQPVAVNLQWLKLSGPGFFKVERVTAVDEEGFLDMSNMIART